VRLLLDTHAWLWMTEAPDRLSPSARRLLSSPNNERFLSTASAWEIAIKYRAGKLRLPKDPATLIPELLTRTQVVALPVLLRHALQVSSLPLHHSDPFDRLLVAQAQIEDLTVVSTDPQFQRYDVKVSRA
jgi:PIN domain nuclease of toxin-antitoxin system